VSDNYDVAIVGYGPTGATAANLLGKLGLRVLVVERDSDVYNRARAISTDEEVMRIWQSIGLADVLQRDMLPDRPLNLVDASGAVLLDLQLTPRGAGHPPQQFLYQPAVDRVLREGVARYPNVDVFLEHECLRVNPRTDGVELVVSALKSRLERRFRASFVIAADGGSSPIRGQLGVSYSGHTYSERWMVIDTKVLQSWQYEDRFRFHANPLRPTVDCPTPLGHHRWEYPLRAADSDQEPVRESEIWSVLLEQGITPQHVRILRAVTYDHHVRVAKHWRVGRIFLAGDAAHAMPPWIGQGMSAGVRDAANLCWKIAATLRDRAPDSVLDSYQTEREPHVTAVMRRACLVGRLVTERNQALARIRDHALRALMRVPGASAGMEKLTWLPNAHYSDGLFVDRRRGAVGWQIPQPWVVSARGGAVRLDDAIGSGWAVLATGASVTGTAAWAQMGCPVIEIGKDIQEEEGTLARWLRRKRASAIVVRPDKFVYAAAGIGQSLPKPLHWVGPGIAPQGTAATGQPSGLDTLQ
jgi:3-(3-hydroxy-phenyl)propionate hydroxylase